MEKFVFAALAAVCCTAPAVANETADQCRDYIAENGGDDDSGCDCLGDAADADPALADALAAIETPEDLDAASDSTKAAIGACFPEAAATSDAG